jgi:hypothetical protein
LLLLLLLLFPLNNRNCCASLNETQDLAMTHSMVWLMSHGDIRGHWVGSNVL